MLPLYATGKIPSMGLTVVVHGHYNSGVDTNDTPDGGRGMKTADGYLVRYLAGRCWNGAQRDAGTKFHAVAPGDAAFGRALCGAEPGRRSNGWAEPHGARGVSCPKCLKRLAAAGAKKAGRDD
jgi:hypothetical protein